MTIWWNLFTSDNVNDIDEPKLFYQITLLKNNLKNVGTEKKYFEEVWVNIFNIKVSFRLEDVDLKNLKLLVGFVLCYSRALMSPLREFSVTQTVCRVRKDGKFIIIYQPLKL